MSQLDLGGPDPQTSMGQGIRGLGGPPLLVAPASPPLASPQLGNCGFWLMGRRQEAQETDT